ACSADSDCPSTAVHCVEGVCCDAECGEACHSCVNHGAEGRCTVVADNTDPRHQCGDADHPCVSCSDGQCTPSVPNTDPETECGAKLVCNGLGACAAPLGTVCTDDLACALG